MAKADARVQVDVEGLKEFRKHLKSIDKSLGKEIGRVHKRLAQEIVLPGVKKRAAQSRPSVGGGMTRLGSRGVKDIKAQGTQKAAAIVAGKKIEYMGGHEWGSKGTYSQFPPASKEGYIIRPAIEEKRDEIIERYGKAMDEATKPAFPN